MRKAARMADLRACSDSGEGLGWTSGLGSALSPEVGDAGGLVVEEDITGITPKEGSSLLVAPLVLNVELEEEVAETTAS